VTRFSQAASGYLHAVGNAAGAGGGGRDGSWNRFPAPGAAIVFLLAATFVLLGIGNSGADDGIIKAGGYVGLATAAAAWYASFAAVTNSTFGRTVLPVMPLKR
jgi:GPR1/FUN34/yaaH family protein